MMHKWSGEGGGTTSPLHHPYEGVGGGVGVVVGGYSHLTTGTPNSYHGDSFVPAGVFNVSFYKLTFQVST
jgi:hypothetical protein